MTHPIRIRKARVALLLAAAAAIVAVLGNQASQSSSSTATPPVDRPRSEQRGVDPALLDALRRAEADAGMDFVIDSGWRSPEHQQRLLDEAVEKYGSEAEAARWVATPETSPHVSGDAVDIAPPDAAAWLSQNGAAYGLCQIYANEPWHYELRPEAVDRGCPAMYGDPTQDPRMQR